MQGSWQEPTGWNWFTAGVCCVWEECWTGGCDVCLAHTRDISVQSTSEALADQMQYDTVSSLDVLRVHCAAGCLTTVMARCYLRSAILIASILLVTTLCASKLYMLFLAVRGSPTLQIPFLRGRSECARLVGSA